MRLQIKSLSRVVLSDQFKNSVSFVLIVLNILKRKKKKNENEKNKIIIYFSLLTLREFVNEEDLSTELEPA